MSLVVLQTRRPFKANKSFIPGPTLSDFQDTTSCSSVRPQDSDGSLRQQIQRKRCIAQWPADCIPAQLRFCAHIGEQNMINKLHQLWLDEEGQDLAEYGLLLILIAVAVVTGIG